MTHYAWDGEGEDPNHSMRLCKLCEIDYTQHMEEQWAEYYSSQGYPWQGHTSDQNALEDIDKEIDELKFFPQTDLSEKDIEENLVELIESKKYFLKRSKSS